MIELLKTFNTKLPMPYAKRLGNNLYELRIKGNQEVRIFYCFHLNKIVLISAFVKKSNKTPQKEIKTAISRLNVLTKL